MFRLGSAWYYPHIDDLIEAPNWTRDGKTLIYNSLGRIFAFDIATRTSAVIESGYATQCNNDHVLSPDNSHLAVSHHTQEDGQSRIYVFPLEGGDPVHLTALAPSYLHGWSPGGTTLSYWPNAMDSMISIPSRGLAVWKSS